MRGRLAFGALALGACSAHLGNAPDDGSNHGDGKTGSDAPMIDAGPDALPAWSMPAGVPGASDPTLNIDDETLNSTQTELYFGIIDATLGAKQLWLSTRATAADAWGTPTKLGAAFNVGGTTPPTEESPRLSPDDTTIYFGRGGDIYTATRTAAGAPWSTPQVLASVSTTNYEKWLAVCNGGYFLVARNTGSGTAFHLYEGQLGAGAGSAATELAGMTGNETSTYLSNDCLTTYFTSSRSGTAQVYMATRATPVGTWNTPQLVTDFDMAAYSDNEDAWISNDQLEFCFASTRYAAPNAANKGVYCSSR